MEIIVYREGGFCLRLGVVLSGTGVHGAACAGVLQELWRRQMEPHAVCALGSGAWPGALFAAGCDAAQMELACRQAQHMGRRMLRKAPGGIRGRKAALYTAEGMQRLLQAQTGGRLLALCPRKAIFPLRSQRSGCMIFASRGCMVGEGVAASMQVSAAFAARAAMGLPPFLEPSQWMGMPLMPLRDYALASSLLALAGAQRILIVETQPQAGTGGDALLLAAACMEHEQERAIEQTMRLTIRIPEEIGAWSYDHMAACMEWGRRTAERELDGLFDAMGLAYCKVLPFKRALHP